MNEQSVENKYAIEKNTDAIGRNQESIKRDHETLDKLDRRTRRNSWLIWFVTAIVLLIAIVLFLNGMMVHRQTGLDENVNQIADDALLINGQ